MSHEGVPLQIDLFTGALADTRTPTQKRTDREREKPEQIELFAQHDLAQFGVRARPQMSLSEHTRLVLIAEDPRTEEEKERDRQREAQALTSPLFHDTPGTDQPEQVQAISLDLFSSPAGIMEADGAAPEDEDDEDTPYVPFPVAPLPSPIAIYRQLVTLSHEQAATLWASRPVILSQQITLSVLRFEARQAGLRPEEIESAICIGTFQGKKEIRTTQPAHSPTSTFPAIPQYGILWRRTSAMPFEMSKL